MSNIVALDIGGTKIYAVRFSDSLQVEHAVTVLTQADKGKNYVLANITYAIEQVKNDQTRSIGIAWAGFVDATQGIIKKAPNIEGFESFPLASFLQSQFQIPVRIDNDARLFAFAEQHIHAKRESCLLGIIIGTGVGSGLIIDGQIVHGASYFAGEIGHMILDEGDTEAEDLFAGPALVRLFSHTFEIQKLQDLDGLWETHEKEIEELFDPVLDRMALWLYNLCLCFNPGRIVFGGGVGQYFLPRFEAQIQKKLQTVIETHGYPVSVKIRFSQLSNAGVLGAALLGKDIDSSISDHS